MGQSIQGRPGAATLGRSRTIVFPRFTESLPIGAALPDKGDYLEKVDPVFRESLATGGRIFSDAHRYFSVPLPGYMNDIVKRIKGKFAYAQDNA